MVCGGSHGTGFHILEVTASSTVCIDPPGGLLEV